MHQADALRLFLIRRRGRKLMGVTGRKFWNAYPEYLDRLGQMDRERMPPGEVEAMQKQEVARSADFERRAALKGGTQDITASLAESAITDDVRTVANIGARVDTVSAYLAERFPDRTFVSLDFQPNLEEINQGIARPNQSFVSGYPLDNMPDTDLVIFNSTACLIPPKELLAYFRLCKSVVLNEPWGPTLKIMDWIRPTPPERIDPFSPPISMPHSVFLHNYPALAREAGLSVECRFIKHRGDLRVLMHP